ncbi:hypothetical protein [Clostridium sp.]
MDKDIVELIKSLLTLGMAMIALFLSTYRSHENEKYAEEYKDSSKMLLFRWLLTYLIKGLSVGMLIGIFVNKIDIFVAFYVMTPLLIALNLIFFQSEKMNGILTFLKGGYYLGVIAVSAIQFFLKSDGMAETAIGLTMALAIFESVSAISDGYKKIKSV